MPINDLVATDQWYRFRWCVEHGHYPFLVKADKCDKFFTGSQWEQQDIDALRLAKRPALTINKIISTISTIMGEQIYNRNEVSYRPAGEGSTSEVADALCKVWKQIAHANQLPWVRSDVFADGIIRSRGFYDVRMDFSKSMKGNVAIKLMNSKNVVIDPDAEEYDPDDWMDVFTTKWLTPQHIELLFNKEDADYLKAKEASLFPYAYDSIERVRDRFSGPELQATGYGIMDKAFVRRNVRVLERQYNKITSQKHFIDVQTGDSNPIPDAWERNRIADVVDKARGQINVVSRKVKRVRWTVTADSVVLHDDWSPYKHFTVVPYFPHFRHGTTVGLVENLLGPQELLNKVSSQELHIVNTSANSGWVTKAGNLINMTIEELEQSGAKSGLILEVQDVAQTEKIQPNATPQGIDRLTYKSEEHMKTISGVPDSMQGMDREDVAAKAIAYKKQSGQTNLVKVMDNLERTDFILARNVLDLIQEFYTEERLIHITHNDLLNESEEITINQYHAESDKILNDLTLGTYSIVISSTPDRGTMEDSQFEQAKSLKELGLQIPDDVLIENSRLTNRAEVIKQMKAAAESPEAQQRKQLELRSMEANVSKLEGEAGEKHAKTGLETAKTQKESIEAQQLAAGGDTAEQMKLTQEMDIERERMDMEREKMREELALKREEAQLKLQLQREMHDQDMEFRRQEAAQKAEQSRADAIAKRQQMLSKSTADTAETQDAEQF